MISVSAAENIIQSTIRDYGTKKVPIEKAIGHILAEPLVADRDMPPYNRVAMDGIAINFESFKNDNRSFTIVGTQPAGEKPINIKETSDCVEIMTGCALPDSCDTIIRYEDLDIKNGTATVTIEDIKQGQNIHRKGSDKKTNDLLAEPNEIITTAHISIAASIGKTELLVKAQPKVVVISNGDELLPINAMPSPYEIRRSNSYTIAATLLELQINADLLHLPDNEAVIAKELRRCINEYDVLIISGGVSAGKFDYIPNALAQLQVTKLFHKVQQRPGKPFWFGEHKDGALVFSFPGNPVSTFMCTYRYFIPWWQSCNQLTPKPTYATLDTDYTFKPALQCFLQVKINVNNNSTLIATPSVGNGSGDFANLLYTDAFMELPAERNTFNKGESFRIWPYKSLHN